MIFFFKQKTAYEIRPRDWSSDVCSSDLPGSAGDVALADDSGGGRPEEALHRGIPGRVALAASDGSRAVGRDAGDGREVRAAREITEDGEGRLGARGESGEREGGGNGEQGTMKVHGSAPGYR